jgi:hypothetical protein
MAIRKSAKQVHKYSILEDFNRSILRESAQALYTAWITRAAEVAARELGDVGNQPEKESTEIINNFLEHIYSAQGVFYDILDAGKDNV